jgi:two-component system sensor histidine kinase GlrK
MYYPRSFLKFLLLGFVLVSLPLGYALFELARGLDRLTRQSEASVVRAAQAGRVSRQLREQTTALERIVRQYLILEDSGQLEDYARVRQDFLHSARTLRSMQLDEQAGSSTG